MGCIQMELHTFCVMASKAKIEYFVRKYSISVPGFQLITSLTAVDQINNWYFTIIKNYNLN